MAAVNSLGRGPLVGSGHAQEITDREFDSLSDDIDNERSIFNLGDAAVRQKDLDGAEGEDSAVEQETDESEAGDADELGELLGRHDGRRPDPGRENRQKNGTMEAKGREKRTCMDLCEG